MRRHWELLHRGAIGKVARAFGQCRTRGGISIQVGTMAGNTFVFLFIDRFACGNDVSARRQRERRCVGERTRAERINGIGA